MLKAQILVTVKYDAPNFNRNQRRATKFSVASTQNRLRRFQKTEAASFSRQEGIKKKRTGTEAFIVWLDNVRTKLHLPSLSFSLFVSFFASVFLILLRPDRSGRGRLAGPEKNSSISLLNEVVATVVTRGETRHDERHSAMGGVIVIRMSYVSVPVFHIPDRNGCWLLDSSQLHSLFRIRSMEYFQIELSM